MRRSVAAVLCSLSLLANAASGQSSTITPVRVAAGTILKFHLQTRLHPRAEDALDALPKGTILEVKMLQPIDSNADSDGTEFHGSIVAPVVLGDEVIVHPEAEVTGLLVLLRSRSHPEGFRYELLITKLTDHGKLHELTASLNPSFLDPSTPPASGAQAGAKTETK